MVLNILARGSRLVLARTQAPASSSSSLTSSAFTATLSTLSISTSSSHSIHSQTAQLYTPPSTQPHNVLNSSQSTRHMSTFGLRTSAATRWTRMAKPKAAAGKKGKKGDGKGKFSHRYFTALGAEHLLVVVVSYTEHPTMLNRVHPMLSFETMLR